MDHVLEILNHLYRSTLIPLYLYENQKLIHCFPEQDTHSHPPIQYVNQLLSNKQSISHITSSFFSYYGGIRILDQAELLVVLGPISQVNYTKDTLRIMKKEYVLKPEFDQQFNTFFSTIPSIPLQHFIHTLLAANYFLNQEEVDFHDYLGHKEEQPVQKKQPSKEIFDEAWKETTNNSYALEELLLRYVEDGNDQGIQQLFEKPFVINEGLIAHDNIRQAKNIAIVTITLTTRAAIRGGVSPKEAFQLSDEYIKQVESMTGLNSIVNLYQESILRFTEKVNEIKHNFGNAAELRPIVTYIQQNTNLPITVNLLTHKFNYSRSYLSTKFKQEMGIPLSQFILQSKLRDGKKLLISTNKSISEISAYLCFSSQSHFQTSFKKIYNTSPGKYRKEHQYRSMLEMDQ